MLPRAIYVIVITTILVILLNILLIGSSRNTPFKGIRLFLTKWTLKIFTHLISAVTLGIF